MVPGHAASVETAQVRATEVSVLQTCPGNIAKIGKQAGCTRGSVGGWWEGRGASPKQGRELKPTVEAHSLLERKPGLLRKNARTL